MPKPVRSDYFQVHSHSEYSVLDGMGRVSDMVSRAASLGHPALALTDHGTMAGVVQLYKSCMAEGIAPFPGIEAYVVSDVNDPDAKTERFHLGLLALDFEGYKALVALSSKSFQPDRFHRKPLIDYQDLFELGRDHGDHVAVTTGCYFGLVVQDLLVPGATLGGIRMVNMLKKMFKHLFVEVQDHGVWHPDHGCFDRDIARQLFDIADHQGLPVVVGQDSHYCEAHHQPVHDLMKDICYFGDGEDNHFPGGPYHLASTKEVRQPWDAKQWAIIEQGHSHLLDLNNVVMPALDKYKFRVPRVSADADTDLSNLVWKALKAAHKDGDLMYASRAVYELETIAQMGFANYFLMVKAIIDWSKKHNVFIDARGSANGSLVCYLLGITTVDPVEWSCDFERFLSMDRKKPPDIDLDVEDASRDQLIDYVRQLFPTMVQIGSYGRIGVTETEDGEEKGSVYVQYAASMRRKEGAYSGVKPEHSQLLKDMDTLDIRKSAGRHAGGFVIPGDGLPIEDYIPTMLVGGKNGHKATQLTMDDVEDCGYVKLDILGLKQLSTMRAIMEMIGKTVEDVEDIPHDDPKACAVLRSGITGNGVFQFEGYSTAKGARQMKVRSTEDAIFCLALFRPAMMASGMTERYLNARSSGVRERLHPGVDPILDATMGVPVFQDQVIELMRAVGLPFEELNDLLKAVKASNDKIVEYALSTFARVGPIFKSLAVENLGATDAEANAMWQTVVDFSDYGFNRSHATNYGIRAYRMAYLKAHYPTEFMAATLATWAGTDKEAQYLTEARRCKIAIGRPDVNKSMVNWSVDAPLRLRKGLLSVKGIGLAAAEAIVTERITGGPYKGVEDFADRLPARPISGVNDLPRGTLKGVCKTLAEAHCLDGIGYTA